MPRRRGTVACAKLIPAFEQQATNLVDDRRATHHRTFAHPVQGLEIAVGHHS